MCLLLHNFHEFPLTFRIRQARVTPGNDPNRSALLLPHFLVTEKNPSGIWLRESTSKMFNIARIPKPYCDIFSSPPPPSSPQSLNLLIMVHNWCYTIPVYHPPNHTTSLSQLMKPSEIEARICAVVVDVEQRLSNGETAVPIGILSADGRDQWAEVVLYACSMCL